MKIIICIFCLINLISSLDYILRAGIKSESQCDKDDLVFKYENCYFVNDLFPSFEEEFSLLMEDSYEAKCQINQINFIYSDFEILCRIENYLGCREGNPKISNFIKKEPDSIFLDDNVLNFEGFTNGLDLSLSDEDNKTITITALDLFKGRCYDKVYKFIIKGSIENSDLGKFDNNKDVEFNFNLSKPKEFPVNCSFLLKNISDINDTINFDINCDIILNNPLECAKNISNDDLTIGKNPKNINIENYTFTFENFENISTIIPVYAGALKKDVNDLNYFLIEINSKNQKIIDKYKLNQNISFKIDYELNNGGKENGNCNLSINEKDIKCEINLKSTSNLINLTILNDPLNYLDIPNKTMKFYNFKNKAIYTIIAGQLIKGKCDKDIYKFQFINSIVPISSYIFITIDYLMYYAYCLAEYNNDIINCEIDNSEDYCLVDEESDIKVVSQESETIISENITIYIDGFVNKETKTIYAENIINKYIAGSNFYFLLNFTSSVSLNFSSNISFDIIFKEKNKEVDLIAVCSLENNSINCSCNNEYLNIGNNSDIIISKNPVPYKLNDSVSINFENFEGLTTYTIVAGQIEIGNCTKDNKYIFRIVNLKQTSLIPKEANITLNLSNKNSICTLKPSNPYSMDCYMDECPQEMYIKLMNEPIEINENSFFPNSLFYNEFNNRGAFSIKAGNINISGCGYNNTYITNYNYKFIDNSFDSTLKNKNTSNIDFYLQTKFNIKEKEGNITCCSLNMTDNIANCTLNISKCPESDELMIEQKTTSDYNLFSPDSIFFFGFNWKNYTIIKTTENSIIIKEKNKIIITENILNENAKINEGFQFNISINISEKFEAIENQLEITCSIPKVDKDKIFNITCIYDNNNYTLEEIDIEIIEEPYKKGYAFQGYKNKKTLTLRAGNLIKEKINNNFKIINNEFSDEIIYKEDKIHSFYLKFNNNFAIKDSYCFFNIKDIDGKKINITCLFLDEIDDDTISVSENPNYSQLNNNITLYFTGFNTTNLYTLTLGKIIKNRFSGSGNYIFFFNETTISKTLIIEKKITLQILINNNEENVTCLVEKTEIFNMKCEFKYNSIDIIDIKYKPDKGYYNYIEFNSSNTLYIKNEEVKTTTLTAGKIVKQKCENNIYEFSIENNSISDNNYNISNGKFIAYLDQLAQIVKCQIKDVNVIKCELNIESGHKYCQNINEDIMIKNIYGYENNNYILINENVIYLHGFENLATYTVESGDIMLGKCNGNIYEFIINDSKIYRNPYNPYDEIEFRLNISSINEQDFKCYLPKNLTINNIFNINCSKEIKNCESILEKKLTIDKNPKDVQFGNKNINFQKFEGETTSVTITAGNVKLSSDNDNLNLIFTNSTIDYDYELINDLNFSFYVELNGINESINCEYAKNKSGILICSLGKITSNDISIKIIRTPEINRVLPGKTIVFQKFMNKTIYRNKISGYLKKGSCSQNYYYFSFVNVTSLELDYDFILQMKKPNKLAYCNYSKNNMNISCYMEGDHDCPEEADGNLEVAENYPDENIYNRDDYITYIVNFSYFKNQNTYAYGIKVDNLIKIGKKGNNEKCLYYFKFTKFEIDNKNFYEKEIIFNNIMIDFNDKKNNEAECKLYKEDINIKSECYFDLNDSYCDLTTEEIMEYDLRINDNVDGKRIAANYPRELNLKGFNNKQTITIKAEHIFDKYKKNNDLFFNIKVEENISEYLKNETFDMKIKNESGYEEYNASCYIKEESIIECNSKFSQPTLPLIYNDIKILSNPDFIALNDTIYTYYFSRFENLQTYTISAGQIQKKNNADNTYFFDILDIKSSYIPFETYINLNIIINETTPKNATCQIKNITDYVMNCKIINVSYIPFDIIFHENTIKTNYSLFNPSTVFFTDFVGKRTLTIKPGQLNKGKCSESENKKEYNFTFTKCEHHYNIDKNISFNLTLNFENEENQLALCSMNLSGIDNTINCKLNDKCPNKFKITKDPPDDYYTLEPNISILFEDFQNAEIKIVKMSPEGKIIKTEFSENNYNFIITNNTIEGNSGTYEKYYFELNINNQDIFANCSIPGNVGEEFNISCRIKDDSNFSVKDEIEILKEPIDLTNDFIGYQSQKTLTLVAGNIIKNNLESTKFDIINNSFLSIIDDFVGQKFNFILDIQFSEDSIDKANCSLNIIDINDYYNISCSLLDNIREIKYISVFKNPEPIKVNNNITLNYYDFKSLNLYYLSLGNIIKGKCEQDKYKFYFINTTISSEIKENISFVLSIDINNASYNSNCEIQANKTFYDMECIIQDSYCPSDNYDIKYEGNEFFFTYKYGTIYIDYFNQSTTTLKAGFLKKESCNANFYNFTITNNELSGNISLDINGGFILKLKEFSSNANCEIISGSIININCSIRYNKNNKGEYKYCSNMNEDINIESVGYKDHNYILVNDKVLHLYLFENLKTHTIEAGDLIRGTCDNNNKYNFNIVNSLIYNNLLNEEKINFNLMLSLPKEINASCSLPTYLTINSKFNISCKISDSQELCPNDSINDEIIRIKNNPDDIINKQLNFKNFTNETNILLINAGNMSKYEYDQKSSKYYFVFENITNNSYIKESISFVLNIEVDGNSTKAECSLNYLSLEMICEIENIESEYINLKILQNPPNDLVTIPEKIITFTNFENKQINTIIAGKLYKGVCQDDIYTFYIKNSITQYKFDNEFSLSLKEPNKNAKCSLINFDNDKKICDIKCSFEKSQTCTDDYEGKDLIIDDKEPENLRIDEYKMIYFNNFKGQNTIVYEIKVGNLIKGEIDNKNCLYNFKFDNQPFNLLNFKENITFKYNISFNNSQVTANCILYEKKNINEVDEKTVDLLCYFKLDSDICKRDDLSKYDLYIGENINDKKQVINSSQEMNLVGFDNKETLTLLGKNIIKKYQENNKINFVMAFDSLKEISSNAIFNFTLNKFKANCSFNKGSRNIKCEELDSQTTIDEDIMIQSTPIYITLNNQSIYFLNFENKRTYTIKAGLIEKLPCAPGKNYNFNLINSSSKDFPSETDFEIPVLINDTKKYNAICTIINSKDYNMSCIISNIYCPNNIILNEIDPNETLFYPNTTFFNNFSNKRTITIKPGKIKKGQCISTSQYNFTFVQNEIDYKTNSIINFNLDTLLNITKLYSSSCSINLSNTNNAINCKIDFCPSEEYDLFINSNPNADYKTLNPNSIFFEDFINKNTTTIIMSQSGMIIKNQNGMILSDNYINENDIIYNQFNITIKLKISEEEKDANCLIPQVKKDEKFNITCTIINFAKENEIEIIEEPTSDNYYFVGYKNKRTMTLKAGSLYKDEEHGKFYIKNSSFSKEYTIMDKDKKEFDLNYKYNNLDEKIAKCFFNITEGYIDSKLQIICSTQMSQTYLETISLLTNPNYILMNGNITLYFSNFNNLNLYSITPGIIIKEKCDSNSFAFNLINTSLSNPLSQSVNLYLPIKINEQDEKESSCIIDKESTKFNMSCKIHNYCPNNNIDIKIEKMQKSNMSIIGPDTLYINISSEKQTSTLNVGYLQKINCSYEGSYFFNINNNNYTGKNLDKKESQFKLKLAQFDILATCDLYNQNITCILKINPNNKYCINIYEDIKGEKIIGDNSDNCILIDGNILHFYGIENLETFTIKGGELNQGSYNNKKYTFFLNNSLAYNKLSILSNNTFSLPILQPFKSEAICSLTSGIEKGKEFDINCEINGDNISYIIQTEDDEPLDLKYNTQVVNFKEFKNKTNKVNLKAGELKLGINGNYRYYLNLTNSR